MRHSPRPYFAFARSAGATALFAALFAGGCTLDAGPLPYGTTDDPWVAGPGTGIPTNPPGGAPRGSHGTTPGASGGATTCSAAAQVGSCAGDQLSYCQDGQTFAQDCAATNTTCGWNAAKSWYECVAKSSTTTDPTPVSNDCGNVTNVGLCSGSSLAYCDNGKLYGADCAAKGAVCGFDAAKSWYDCLDSTSRVPPRASTCNGFPQSGLCKGDELFVCDAGSIVTNDCAAIGGTCGLDASGLAGCITSAPPTSACGSVDAVGKCDGATVLWCDGGTLQNLDCAGAGRTCGWNDTQKFYDCVDLPPVTDGCGGVDAAGVCTGAALAYCQAGALVTETCAFGCGWNEAAGYNDCFADPGTPVDTCSGVDAAGVCTGAVLAYCQSGALVTETCAFGCGWNEAAGYNDCFADPGTPVDTCSGVDAAGVCTGALLSYCSAGAIVNQDCPFGCGWNATAGYNDCFADPGVPIDPCAAIDPLGICTGATLTYCDTGVIYDQDCQFGCGWDGAAGYYACLADPGPPVDPCGGIDAAGVCDADVLSYCQTGTLVVEPCVFGCGWNEAAGFSECLPDPGPPVDPCGGIDAAGLCEGATLTYCSDGALFSETCLDGCGWNTGGYYACLPPPTSDCGTVDAVGVCDGLTLWYCQDGLLETQSCTTACGFDATAGYYRCL
jgi:hypothetical protein